MKLNATVVWPVNVTVEVPENATTEEKKKAIVEMAESFLDVSDPVIHDCSDSDCID